MSHKTSDSRLFSYFCGNDSFQVLSTIDVLTMLRWTCRLRDALVAGCYQFIPRDPHDSWRDSVLPWMREAEIVYPQETNGFPSDFDWREFQKFFYFPGNYGPQYAVLRRSGNAADNEGSRFVDYGSVECQKIRALAGQPIEDITRSHFDVVWLSPEIFLSQTCFVVDGSSSHFEYQVDFGAWFGANTSYYAYSLNAFQSQGNSSDQASPLPLELLCHLTANLPADSFYEVALSVCSTHRRRFPAKLFDPFLSILPHSAVPSEYHPNERITFRIATEISQDDLHVIFSHRLHPNVKLKFEPFHQSGCSPFDESVSIVAFNEALRAAKQSLTIELPLGFVKDKWAEGSRLVLKSPKLTLAFTGLLPSAWLHAIAAAQSINDIHIEFKYSFFVDAFYRSPPTHSQALLRLYIHALFELSTLECLQIHFEYKYSFEAAQRLFEADRKRFDVQPIVDNVTKHIKRVRQWIPRAVPPCVSTSLCHVYLTSDTPCLDRINWWDRHLFPTIVLNYARKHRLFALEQGVVGLAIAAVNEGNVYRKVTDHEPHDMSIANAGLILRTIKVASRF
jgi:hypothetical protein